MSTPRLVPRPVDALDRLDALEQAIPDLQALEVTPETLARLQAINARVGALVAGAHARALAAAMRPAVPEEPDREVGIAEAAKFIGGMSHDFMRDHRVELGVIYRGSRLHFSTRKLRAWQERGGVKR